MELRTKTHNKGKIHSFKSLGKVDYLFAYTESGESYLIPRKKITQRTSITLNKNWDEYKV